MDLEAQLIAAGYSPADAKKFADGFTQGLAELGITDIPANNTVEDVPALAKITNSPNQIDKILIKLGCRASRAQAYGNYIEQAMIEFEIHTPKPSAMFVAQIIHESTYLSAIVENLNYSEQGLVTTFGKYFDRNTAHRYARQPEKIANRVYANRMGNGPEGSGDGWRYRGRGLIQISGKDNYAKCSEHFGNDLLKNPEILETHDGASRSAAWFWWSHNLNKSAEAGDIKTNTRLINGGLNGYDDRVALYNKALKLF